MKHRPCSLFWQKLGLHRLEALAVVAVCCAALACADGGAFEVADAGECTGAEQCQCYGNGTCDPGLSCLSQRCVNVAPADGTAADGAVTAANDAGAQSSEPSNTGEETVTSEQSENEPTSPPDESNVEPPGETETDAGTAPSDVTAEEPQLTDTADAATGSSEPGAPDAGGTTAEPASDGGELSEAPSVDAGATEVWTMTEGLLDGNDGWSAEAESGIDFGAGCVTLWGLGKVLVTWRGPVERPMLLDPNTTYRLRVEGSLENLSKFLFAVQFAAVTTPDAPHELTSLNVLSDGDFEIEMTFTGIEQPGAVGFVMNVLDASEPYGRVCFDSADLRAADGE